MILAINNNCLWISSNPCIDCMSKGTFYLIPITRFTDVNKLVSDTTKSCFDVNI